MSLSLDSGALNARAADDVSIWERLGKEWARIETPETPFVTGEGDANAVDPNDVRQDGYGSCGVMSTLETIAQQNPAAIQQMIQDNGDGTYTVTFQEQAEDGSWQEVEVTVSGPFDGGAADPSGDVNSRGEQEIWPAIIEKAYAQQYKSDDQHYGSGVFPSDVMEHVLGADADTAAPDQVSFADMEQKLDDGEAVVAWTAGFDTAEQKTLAQQYGISGGHAYSVSDVVPAGTEYTDPNTGQTMTATEDMVILDNPWGHGDVVMPYSDFQAAYYRVDSAPTH